MNFDAPLSIVVFGAAAIAATLAISYRSLRLGSWTWQAVALEGMRLLIVLGGVFTLLQPEFVAESLERRRPVAVVLYDDSDSMSTKDVERGDESVARSAALDRVKSPETWASLADRMEVVIAPFSSRLDEPKTGTDLNDALSQTLEAHEELQAVVLASDGDWNTGSSPAEAARALRRREVPVYALGVGSTNPLPNLAIADVNVPAFAVVDKPLRIPFRLSSTLDADADVSVEIELPGEKSQLQTHRVPAHGEAHGVVEWRPTKPGDGDVVIRVQKHRQDQAPEDNEATASINVRNESIRVLMIDTYPRWEYRYIRNALQRDPGVEVRCLLLHPSLKEPASGRDYLAAFPDKEMLFQQDVVILGDVGVAPGQLTQEQCEQLQQLVESHAAGIVMIPGFRGYQATLENSPLSDLLPIELDSSKPKGVRSAVPAQLELTEQGRDSLLTRLESQPAMNDEVWRKLPGFYWHAATMRARPGSKVLATHASASSEHGRTPIIVTRTHGIGKVLFMGADGAWRWRRGVEDLYHYRFWSQMVRWMAYQRTMSTGESMRMFFTPDRPRGDDVVTIHASVMDGSGEPLSDGTVMVQIVSPAGKTSTVTLEPVGDDAWGHFSGSFVPNEAGRHKLVATCRETAARLEAEIAVLPAQRELVGRPANFEALKEVAKITGGTMASVDDVEKATGAIAALPEPKPQTTIVRLWSHPLWGGALVSLAALFWTGRKLAGLF